MSHKLQISLDISNSSNGSLLSLRSQAHAVTLSGFAGGEFLPLPRSKGAVFPFLLILEGSPTASATSLRDSRAAIEWGISSFITSLTSPMDLL